MKERLKTCLWFDDNAEEAVVFYVSLFENARINSVLRCGPDGPGSEGSVLTMTFELVGQHFMAVNGGPTFKLTEAVSIVAPCDTQEELDALWDRLLDGGEAQQCGWLKDRYGLSWQIVPARLGKMLGDGVKGWRVMAAIMSMVKLDIAALEKAYEG